jgi:hypothetical protein
MMIDPYATTRQPTPEPSRSRRNAARMITGTIALLTLLQACGGRNPTLEDMDDRATFWFALEQLCDQSYRGEVKAIEPAMPNLSDQPLLLHIVACDDRSIEIALHVGPDHSRVWTLTRGSENALLLDLARYDEGGSVIAGDAARATTEADEGNHRFQIFYEPGDKKERSSYRLQVVPGYRIIYEMENASDNRMARLEFDLSQDIPDPPPSWKR